MQGTAKVRRFRGAQKRLVHGHRSTKRGGGCSSTVDGLACAVGWRLGPRADHALGFAIDLKVNSVLGCAQFPRLHLSRFGLDKVAVFRHMLSVWWRGRMKPKSTTRTLTSGLLCEVKFESKRYSAICDGAF
jgi:hypothetical protein